MGGVPRRPDARRGARRRRRPRRGHRARAARDLSAAPRPRRARLPRPPRRLHQSGPWNCATTRRGHAAVPQPTDAGVHRSAPRRPRRGLGAYVRLARPKQWLKNVLVVAAPGAAGRAHPRRRAVQDGHRVRLLLPRRERHLLRERRARRRSRPPAPEEALPPDRGGRDQRRARRSPSASCLLVAAIALSFAARWELALVVGGYLALTVAYSVWLKNEAVIDLAAVAAGFVLRTIAGGVAVGVEISPWFLIVAASGSLFMVTGKRHAELLELGDDAGGHRRALDVYSHAFLSYVRAVASSVAILAYCLWAFEKSAAGREPHLVRAVDRAVRARGPALRLAARAGQGRRAGGTRARRTARCRSSAWRGWRCSRSRSMVPELARPAPPTRCSRVGAAPRRRARTVWAPTPRRGHRAHASPRSAAGVVVARGLGRSYGDAAQNAGGTVVLATGLDRVLELDVQKGELTAEAGVSLDTLLRLLVPLGWFPMVVPGTRYVTLGGAVASDIHGKFRHGTFSDYVSRARRSSRPVAGALTVGPDDDPDVFWATAGGMGLTGIVTEVTMTPAAGRDAAHARRHGTRTRHRRLHGAHARRRRRATSTRSPGSTASSPRRGTSAASVLTRGQPRDARRRCPPRSRDALRRVRAARSWCPRRRGCRTGCSTGSSLGAFNELWFRRHPKSRQDELQGIGTVLLPARRRRAAGTASTARAGSCSTSSSCPNGAEASRPPGPRTVERRATARRSSRC